MGSDSPRGKLSEQGDSPASDLIGKAGWVAIVIGLVLGAALVWRTLVQNSASAPVPTASASAPAASAAGPARPPRCVDVAPAGGLTLGEQPPARPAGAGSGVAGAPGGDDAVEEDPLSPFAVEVGQATAYEGGFAAGVLHDAEGGTMAMLATLGADGQGGRVVRLARSRGDMDPPVVAARGASVLVAMLEPNAGGRAIKIARVTGGEVTWGPELSEGRDESLALDLAAGASRAIIVWDDVPPDAKVSSVMLASFDPDSLHSATQAKPVSTPKLDADSPRVIPRPGGFWLAYVAHGEEVKPRPTDREGDKKRKDDKKADKKDDGEGEGDEGAGEAISHAWVEVVPLDDNGVPTSAPRRATSKDGNVLAFDLERGDDGGAILAWRDDDTPSGSSGGTVSATLVTASGVAEPKVLAEEGVGTGVPKLLPGWIAVSELSGSKRLAAMNGAGALLGSLVPEPSLKNGEPIASTKDAILLASPRGKSMRLSVVKCAPDDPGDAPDGAAP